MLKQEAQEDCCVTMCSVETAALCVTLAADFGLYSRFRRNAASDSLITTGVAVFEINHSSKCFAETQFGTVVCS